MAVSGADVTVTDRVKRRRIANACEACKRRKERCSGEQPCERCTRRGVHIQCRFTTYNTSRRASDGSYRPHATSLTTPGVENGLTEGQEEDHRASITEFTTGQESPDSPLEHSRLIRDHKGRYMFIGDSANLSFLQTIRRHVEGCLGSCAFVDDPLRYFMVEASPDVEPTLVSPASPGAPPAISLAEAQSLIQHYLLATNCVLDLFNENDLFEYVPAWLHNEQSDTPIPRPMYYLVLAIGAQTGPTNKDDLAAEFFTFGRHLIAQSFMEDASMRTVQAYALITMYLLGACRRNAAFMYLGIAVRAAYAIGLHRREVATSFSSKEFEERERVWKVLRILDLSMSASLGRPPSTTETRDTQDQQHYSASTDLCAIFEKVLTEVYSKRKVSTEVLANIGAHHRKWASRFSQGLAVDNIAPTEKIKGDTLPNIGLLHIKEAYYWTIILLTRPFLCEAIRLHVEKADPRTFTAPAPCTATFDTNNKILVHACVDSAIRTLDLLMVLHGCEELPKRLPFVVDSIFIAALVLGFAYFGDLYQTFPLQQYLQRAHQLISQFKHDAVAQRNANIIAYLQEACDAYLEKRTVQTLDHQGRAVGVLFGQIHSPRSQAPTRAQSPGNFSTDVATNGVPNHDPTDMNGARNLALQSAHPESLSNVSEFSYAFSNIEDFMNIPYPVLPPNTLYFDTLNDTTPLFSTISAHDQLANAGPRL